MGRKYLPWRRRALRRPKGHNSIDLDKVGSSSSDSDVENGNLEIKKQLEEAETNMIKNTNIEELNDDDDTEEDEVYANDPFEGGNVFIGGLSQEDQPIIRTVKEAVIRSDIDRLGELLLEGAPIGDGLLHAVSLGCPQIVQTICDFIAPKDAQERNNVINKFACGSEFLASTTALQLAANQNDFEIIQILIRHGAILPDLKTCLHAPGVKGDKFIGCFAFLQYVKALGSPSLIILTETNPVGRTLRLAIDLYNYSECGSLKRSLLSHPNFTSQIDEVVATSQELLCNLLDQCKSKREIEVFLAISASPKCVKSKKVLHRNSRRHKTDGSTLPVGLEQAISLDFKKLVAHPFSQMAVTKRVYHGPVDWDGFDSIQFIFLSLLVIILSPLLCLSYSICPVKKLVNFMETPYVRILNTFSSHLLFLLLLLLTSININFETTDCPDIDGLEYSESLTCSIVTTRFWPVYGRLVIIVLLAAGQAMWTFASIGKIGVKSMLNQSWSWIMLSQTLLYTASLIAYSVSYLQVETFLAVGESNVTDVIEVRRQPSNVTVYFSFDGVLYQPSRANWDPFDAQILAELTFAVANIITVQRLLHTCIYFESIGSLIISMGRMLSGVFKFAVVASLIIFSFALGFTQLFGPYSDLKECTDDQVDDSHCGNAEMFSSLRASSHTLFWAIFGEYDIVDMNLPATLFVIQYTGQILHSIYIIVTSIILLNMLIAAMLTTYESIQGDLHTEWKFARTNMLKEYCGHRSNVPVPYNLFPSVRVIWGIMKRLYRLTVHLLARFGVRIPERCANRLQYHWKRKEPPGLRDNHQIGFKERHKILATLIERYKHVHLKISPPPSSMPHRTATFSVSSSRLGSVDVSTTTDQIKPEKTETTETSNHTSPPSTKPSQTSLEVIPENDQLMTETQSNGNPNRKKHTSSVSLV